MAVKDKIPDAVWAAIRTEWEYGTDEPSLSAAAERAALKHGFVAPHKASISRQMKADAKAGNSWERRTSLIGINQAAHRKADAIVLSAIADNGELKPTDKAFLEQANRTDSEDERARVLARHRQEWQVVAALRQEGLKERKNDLVGAINKLKLAKLAAETTKIQQEGERKAWGLDDFGFDPSKLSDEELEKIIKKG